MLVKELRNTLPVTPHNAVRAPDLLDLLQTRGTRALTPLQGTAVVVKAGLRLLLQGVKTV